MDELEISFAALTISDLTLRQEYIDRVCHEDTALRRRICTRIDALQQEKHAPPSDDLVTIDLAKRTEQGGTGGDSNAAAEKTLAVQQQHAPVTEVIRTVSDEAALSAILQKSDEKNSIGRLLNYEIRRVIGRGAFGIVLEGFDTRLRRVVAIKLLAPTSTARRETSQQFLSEARAVAAIRHSNVVDIYSIHDEPIPFLVMEYIPGKTLQGLVEVTGPLPLSSVLEIGHQIARGLASAHQKGLVHRDIKPSNILLEEANGHCVKITDFGLASDIQKINITQGGLIAGTPMYMAPEQAEGKEVDQRSDLFSLGSVLYFMITGRAPFEGKSTAAILNQVIQDFPPAIQSIVPSVPASLCEIVATLHSKKPESRYRSAEEVADLLSKSQADMQFQRFPEFDDLVTPPADTRAGAEISSKNMGAQPVAEPLSRLKKHHWFATTIVSLVVLAGYLTFPKGETKRSSSNDSESVSAATSDAESAPSDSTAKFSFKQLKGLLNETAIGAGNPDDVTVTEEYFEFDATAASPTLWVNFFAIDSPEWTFTTSFRNLTRDRYGCIKVVFMPNEEQETSGIICNWTNKSTGYIEVLEAPEDEVEPIPLPLIDTGEWTEIKLVVNPEEIQFHVAGNLVTRARRRNQKSGHLALCVCNWRCQFKNPQVVMTYAPRPAPEGIGEEAHDGSGQ
ncbi:serine/threonine-protein kinase [Schlesneria sp. DSM 10557]|uniref:serine/threonine-protein kinase n=1 Tax=Schlesneria sp. DSM 10557 TaxID=3044399 RepID=UPI0035A1C315